MTIEFYKYLYGLLAPLMKGVFTKIVIKYNLQSCRVTFLSNSKTKKYGIDTVVYKATQIWNMLQARFKIFSLLGLSKSEIKKLAL